MEQRRFPRETGVGRVVGEAERWGVLVCDAEGAGFGWDWGEGL